MNDISDIEQHMRSFAEAFILSGRKEKWIGLLCERPDTITKSSSKLFNHLDHNFIEQNDLLVDVAPYDTAGIFYNFSDSPKCISLREAIDAGEGSNAIFSIKPGELAVCFFHDGWNFVCKK